MKKIMCFAASCCICVSCLCQLDGDSSLLANSEKYKVQQHKGLFGLSKPAFGAFATSEVSRFDSTVRRKRTKDSSYVGVEISREGTDIDNSKFMTIEKTKFYRLQLSENADTVETIFSIASVSKEKKQTFLGKVLSKNDEGKDVVLNYNRDISGIIKPEAEGVPWKFFIKDFTSGGRQTADNPFPTASISGGYLVNKDDSLWIKTYSSFGADIILVDNKGTYISAIEFRQKPFYVWIRKDIDSSYQKAIAAFFAVIFAIKDF